MGACAVIASSLAATPSLAHGAAAKSSYHVKAHLVTKSITVDKRATVRGTVSPAAAHKAAALQLRSGGRWVTVARTHLTKKSAFAFSYQPHDAGSVSLRVAVPAGGGHRAGDSKRLTLRVKAAPYIALANDHDTTNCVAVADGSIQCWGRQDGYRDPAPVRMPGFAHVTAVATTQSTLCAIEATGNVMCDELNFVGQVGSGSTATYVPKPAQVTGMHTAVSLVGNNQHFCALKRDKSVWCWGEDTDDQLGRTATTEGLATPVKVAGLGPATSIAAGPVSTCATVTTGGVYCWGRPIADNNTSDDTVTPTSVGVTGHALTVSIGGEHACALIRGGRVECWGSDDNGQLGNGVHIGPPTTTPTTVAGIATAREVTAGTYTTCVVLQGGKIICFGSDYYGEIGNGQTAEYAHAQVHGITNARAVVQGRDYACALLTTGAAKCWGNDANRSLGDDKGSGESAVPTPVAPVAWGVTMVNALTVTVHAGDTVNVAGAVSPAAPGRVVTLTAFDFIRNVNVAIKHTRLSARSRYRFSYVPTSPGNQDLIVTVARTSNHSTGTFDGKDVGVEPVYVSVAAGHGHGCGTAATGQALCWGDDTDGALGPQSIPSLGAYQVSDLPPVKQVVAGLDFSCGLLRTGHVDCWGDNSSDQLGDGTDPQIAGKIEPVTGITNATAIAAGERGACAVLTTGSVKCWGEGENGQLGNGSAQNSPVPVTATGITNAVAVTSGAFHTCALLKTGHVDCWGENNDGQLGRGSPAGAGVPVAVADVTNATEISAGYRHTCALLATGHVDCWGNNDFGELGADSPNAHDAPVTVTGITGAVSVGAGGYHTCAVLASGAVKCWGQGDLGELGNGHKDTGQAAVTVSGLTDATTVVSGYDNSCAILGGTHDTGDAWCWGNDVTDQDGDNTGTTESDVPIQVILI
jgi:alpha-tubulin suppressor-like RCC1 family protein